VLLVLLLALSGCNATEAIAYWFGPHTGEAVEVARCESGLDPHAVSPDGANHGLMQINVVHRRQFEAVTGRPWSDVYDQFQNARYARWLYDQQGWAPWTCRPGRR
jgi:hypothetical protein